MSVTGEVEDYGLYDACTAIGWNVHEIDGHGFTDLIQCFDYAMSGGGRTMIVANTIKGKGVSFMEGQAVWHNKALTEELYRKGLAELGY